ncbi:MAG: DUF2270 domain-containing protein [Acidobacteriota bacterium]|nr:MAG: DUF2270 domain-containing protein [Acidobacteriota bacterium]
MTTKERFDPTDFEAAPLTRSEYIQTLIHFYRGEVSRSSIWRQRLDNTTNWAVVTTAAIITFTFSDPFRTHVLLLLSNFVILGFLIIEARRFRFFSVYRARVRMLEENFILPIVTRNLTSPKHDWRELVAMDLDVPKFKLTELESMALRVRYNYYWVFSAIGLSWLLKTWLHPEPASRLDQWYAHMGVGAVPGWVVLSVGLLFFFAMSLLFLMAGRVPVISEDEIHGFETDRSHWKL